MTNSRPLHLEGELQLRAKRKRPGNLAPFFRKNHDRAFPVAVIGVPACAASAQWRTVLKDPFLILAGDTFARGTKSFLTKGSCNA